MMHDLQKAIDMLREYIDNPELITEDTLQGVIDLLEKHAGMMGKKEMPESKEGQMAMPMEKEMKKRY